MVKIQLTKSGQHIITVPKYVIEALRAKRGDEIEFLLNMSRGTIEIKKIEVDKNDDKR
jgi:bifunctional DNA-binding transcriptional regulator/antitoxin component of YhaV-PrlF toxin-antitoxin module